MFGVNKHRSLDCEAVRLALETSRQILAEQSKLLIALASSAGIQTAEPYPAPAPKHEPERMYDSSGLESVPIPEHEDGSS